MSRLDPAVVGRFEYDGADPSNLYLGNAATGTLTSSASWRIAKIEISGTSIAIKHPNGSPEYHFVWDNRASYTYS